MAEKQKVYIDCVKCGKRIEKKANRLYCIKCRNEVDRELARLRREAHKEEYREKDRKRYEENRKATWPRNVLYV